VFDIDRAALQGNRILIASGEDFEEIIFFQCGLELFGTDAAFGSFLLFEQVERDMSYNATSRTQCNSFSIDQCLRTSCKIRSALPVKLEM